MKIRAGSSPEDRCGASSSQVTEQFRRTTGNRSRKSREGLGARTANAHPQRRAFRMRAPCDTRGARHGPSRPKPTITTCAGRVPSGARGCLSSRTLAAVSSTEKKSRRKLESSLAPMRRAVQRRGDFRVAHLSKGAQQRPDRGPAIFPGRAAAVAALVVLSSAHAYSTLARRRPAARSVTASVGSPDTSSRRWARTCSAAAGVTPTTHDLAVFRTQLPREFHRDRPVAGHDGMLRRRGRRPVAQLLAQQKTHRCHCCHCRGGGREEASDPERYRKRACTLGRRRVQHEQLKIVKEDVRPASAKPRRRVM